MPLSDGNVLEEEKLRRTSKAICRSRQNQKVWASVNKVHSGTASFSCHDAHYPELCSRIGAQGALRRAWWRTLHPPSTIVRVCPRGPSFPLNSEIIFHSGLPKTYCSGGIAVGDKVRKGAPSDSDRFMSPWVGGQDPGSSMKNPLELLTCATGHAAHTLPRVTHGSGPFLYCTA